MNCPVEIPISLHWLERERLNSSAADIYTAALVLAKVAFNITSKLAEAAAYGDGNRI